MPKASVKRLIDNRKDKLIEFVLDIEKYPEFIPFCENSKVYERSDNGERINIIADLTICLLYTSPSPRDKRQSRMPSSA